MTPVSQTTTTTMPTAATPLTLERVVAVAAAIEVGRGEPLSIGESSLLKARYHQLTAGPFLATVADLLAAVPRTCNLDEWVNAMAPAA